MKKEKICMIPVSAPNYRKAVFKSIDDYFNCDWFVGITNSSVKKFNTSCLKNVVNYNHSNSYWKNNVLHLLFRKKYKIYIIGAESRCVSDYLFIGIKNIFFPKKRVYLWTHGWYGKETFLEKKLKLWMFNRADGLFVYGDYARNLLIKEGLSLKKIFTIHNSLDYNQQLMLRNKCVSTSIYKEHFNNENPTIIFIGRLTIVKRLDLLIDAIAELKKLGKYYNVVFVGDGNEKRSLEILAKKRNIDNQIWFYGSCYDEAVNAELVYNADLCVSPGNIGLTAVHVMMFGCPAITHNDFKWQMPEFEAIREGKTGDFFERGNMGSLVETIIKWFDDHQDNRHEVREACFDEIDEYWNPAYQIRVIEKMINSNINNI